MHRKYAIDQCRVVVRCRLYWEEHRVTRRHAQHVYVVAEQTFNERSRVLLMNAPNSRKWWFTVKTAVSGVSSIVPPLLC